MYQGKVSSLADENIGLGSSFSEQISPIPSSEEVNKWLLTVLKHSIHVEYFLGILGYGKGDFQRPHDLVGLGNKYDPEVIKGLALQFRIPHIDFNKYIAPSREFHRRNQYHHLAWNGNKPNADASCDEMIVGAIDAVCSLLENREYSGGAHSYEQVQEILKDNPAHKVYWTSIIIPQMKCLRQPDLETITDLSDFPNVCLSDNIYKAIVNRTKQATAMLRSKN